MTSLLPINIDYANQPLDSHAPDLLKMVQYSGVSQNYTTNSEKPSNHFSADQLSARTRRARLPTIFRRSKKRGEENLHRASSIGAHQRLPHLMRQHRTTYPRSCHRDRYSRADR